MRFGMRTASGMRPKDLRIRFLPVNDCAIMAPLRRAESVPRRRVCPCVHPRFGRGAREMSWLHAVRRTLDDSVSLESGYGAPSRWSEGSGPRLGAKWRRAPMRMRVEDGL